MIIDIEKEKEVSIKLGDVVQFKEDGNYYLIIGNYGSSSTEFEYGILCLNNFYIVGMYKDIYGEIGDKIERVIPKKNILTLLGVSPELSECEIKKCFCHC